MRRQPLKKFSQKVQALLAEHAMSRADLAAALDVDRSWITRILKQTSSPSDENVEAIAGIFGVTFDYLVNEDVDAPPITAAREEKAGAKRRVAPPYPPGTLPPEALILGIPRHHDSATPGGPSRYEITLQTLAELYGAEEIVKSFLRILGSPGGPYRHNAEEEAEERAKENESS